MYFYLKRKKKFYKNGTFGVTFAFILFMYKRFTYLLRQGGTERVPGFQGPVETSERVPGFQGPVETSELHRG